MRKTIRNNRLLWWFIVLCAFYNTIVVLYILIIDKVSFMTWLNGFAAIYLARLAGPYPIKEKNEE